MTQILRVFDPTFGDRLVLAPFQSPPPAAASVAGGLMVLSGQGVIQAAGVSPAGTGSDYVLAAFTIAAGALSPDLVGLTPGFGVQAWGSFGANGNTKRVKFIFAPTAAQVGQVVSGGTVIADSGASTANGAAWSIMANVFKYGVVGANTQISFHTQSQIGATVTALTPPTLLTANENAPILVAVTGNSSSLVGDIVFSGAFLEPLS